MNFKCWEEAVMDDSNIKKTDIKSLFELAMKLYQLPEQQNEAKKVFRQITEIPIDYDNVDELYYKGMSHFYSGWETTKAIQYFKKILKMETTDSHSLFKIGNALYSVSEYHNANKFFEKILEAESKDVNILFETGKYLLIINNTWKALDCFDKVLNLSNNISDLFNKAALLTSLKLNSIASEYYNKILSLTENNSQIEKYYKGLSAYYLLQDSIAIKYFKEVAKEENQNIKILLDTANKLYILKQPIEAYSCLLKTLNLDNNNIAILCDSTKLFYFLNKPNETEECIEKILKLQTDDLVNLYDLAEFLNSNRNSSATKLYEKISSIEKPDCRTQESYIKAVCKIILKKSNGEDYFFNAQKKKINDIQNIYWLRDIAFRLQSLNRYDLALNCFEKILTLNDTSNDRDANILIIKAIALKVLDRKKESIDCFNKILELNVTNVNFLYGAGLQSSGMDNKTAQQFFEKISKFNIPIQNSNAEQLYIAGMSEYFLHHKNAAKKYSQNIDIRNLNDAKLLLDIGIVMSNLNEGEFANNCFNRIVQITPVSEFDYINIGTAYKYLMDIKTKKIKKVKECAEKNYWEAVVNNEDSTFQFNHFSPFINNFFNNDTDNSDKTDNDENKIYHYTDIKALQGILDKQEFWVTKSEFLNDPSETSYMPKVLGNNILNDVVPNLKDLINEIEDKKNDVYILSLSADGDSLPMWKNYSNNDGYNIRVDKDKFKNSFVNPGTFIGGKVIYIDSKGNDENQFKPIKDLLFSIYQSGKAFEKQNNKLTDELIKKALLSHIRLISLFVKHTGFEYEHEYRYAFIPQFWLNNKIYECDDRSNTSDRNDRNDEQKTHNYNGIVNYYSEFRTNGKGLIPYIKIPIYGLTDPKDHVIEEIRFSPTLDNQVTKQGINDYFELKCDGAKINVEQSSIPFRNI